VKGVPKIFSWENWGLR